MESKSSINERGVIAIPAALRRAYGLEANDELLIEAVPEGILLRPTISVPVELYTEERISEFAEDEQAIRQASAGRQVTLRVFLDANVLFSASNVGSNVASRF